LVRCCKPSLKKSSTIVENEKENYNHINDGYVQVGASTCDTFVEECDDC
jgi:hypothetical protein